MKALLISTDSASNEYRVTHNAYGGVAYYRLIAPQKAVAKLGHEWEHFGNNLIPYAKGDLNTFLKGYDIVIAKHMDSPHQAKNVRVACDKNRIPLIYDLDDDLLSIRDDNPAYKSYAEGEMKRVYLATNLSFADALFVSTEPLKESYGKFFKDVMGIEMPIYVLPNYNDASLFTRFKSEKNKDVIVIGYHGSVTHNHDLKMVLPTIDRLMDEFPNVYMELVGTLTKDTIPDVFKGIKNKDRFLVRGGTPAFDNFPKLLMSLKWDIGIAPLIDDTFNKGKSHIKYMEMAMKKIPVVASDVYPYTHNAREALLAKSTNDWYKMLKMLILDKNKRDFIANRAFRHVTEELQYEDRGQMWIDACETVIKDRFEKGKRL